MENKSLREKLKIFSTLLTAITVFVTIISCYEICNFIVLRRNKEVNELKVENVTSKTNEALATVEEVVNLIIGASWMQEMIDSGDHNLYNRTVLAKQMESYLQEKLMFGNHIDTVLFSGNGYTTTLYNNINDTYYGLEKTDWYQEVVGSIKNDGTDYYLFSYNGENTSFNKKNRISIVYPLWEKGKGNYAYCLILFLSDKFIENLTFTDASVLLEDQNGNRIEVRGEIGQEEGWIEERMPLNIQGWNVINRFPIGKIRSGLKTNLLFCIGMGIFLLFVSWFAADRFGRWLMDPVDNLSRQLHEINEVSERESRIAIKQTGSFQSKISVYFAILIISVIAPIVTAFYFSSNRIIVNSIGSSLEFNVDMIMQQVDLICSKYENIVKEIAVSDSVQQYMNNNELADRSNLLEDDLMNFQIRYDDIVNIAFYDKNQNGLYSTFYSNELLNKSNAQTDTDYILEHYGKPLFRIVTDKIMNRECIRGGIQVIDVNPVSGRSIIKGVLIIDFNADKLMECISNLKNFRNVKYKYVDLEGTDLFQILPEYDQRISLLEKGDYYLYKGKTNSNDWNFTVAIPRREYMLHKYQLGYISIILFFLMLSVGIGFLNIFRRPIDRNIKELLKVSEEVKAGNLQTRYYGKGQDELSELGEQFNRMLERLNLIMDEKIASEIREKDAIIKVKELELELLQAQIKPHFLYNTLRAIEAMVILNDSSAVHMIELLIKLFRTGISRGDKIVTLEEELEHVKVYSELEFIRYGNKFEVLYEIPSELLKAKVLKLTLQPLVENAILHGVFGIKDGGCILIKAEREEDMLILSVIDNGIGMSEERLNELRNVLDNDNKTGGIGLYNVNTRIKLRFGNIYGINIESKKKEGTKVKVSYPI